MTRSFPAWVLVSYSTAKIQSIKKLYRDFYTMTNAAVCTVRVVKRILEYVREKILELSE